MLGNVSRAASTKQMRISVLTGHNWTQVEQILGPGTLVVAPATINDAVINMILSQSHKGSSSDQFEMRVHQMNQIPNVDANFPGVAFNGHNSLKRLVVAARYFSWGN